MCFRYQLPEHTGLISAPDLNCVGIFTTAPSARIIKQIPTQQGKAGLTSHPLGRKAEHTALNSRRELPLPGTHISRMDDAPFPHAHAHPGHIQSQLCSGRVAQKQPGLPTLYGKHRLQTSLHLWPTVSASHCSPAPQTSPSPQTPM